MSFTRLPPLRALLAGGHENAERDQTQTAPAPLWLRLLSDPSPGGAMATLGAAAKARRSCILSLTRALQGQCAAAKTWSPATSKTVRWRDVHVAEAGHANELGDELQQFPAWKPRRGYTVDAVIRGFNQVQNLLLSRRLRLHHPERCC